MKEHNDLMLEYMKEKDIASLSSHLLRGSNIKNLLYNQKLKNLKKKGR